MHYVGVRDLWKALVILVWILGLKSKTAQTQFQPTVSNMCHVYEHHFFPKLVEKWLSIENHDSGM